jgi:phenylpropionate dioxygenase-like ring-hydroxylating dioxygenase large terminal subunit
VVAGRHGNVGWPAHFVRFSCKQNKEIVAMIRNQWYVLLESIEVGKKPVGVTRLGENLVFWRDPAGKVSAAVDRCPHRGVALSAGTIEHELCNAHFTVLNTILRGNVC